MKKTEIQEAKELRAHESAKHWATNCHNTVFNEAARTNHRHNRIAQMHQQFMEVVSLLSEDRNLCSKTYRTKLQELCENIEEEMDFCIEKMILLKLITDNNFEKEGAVAELYNAFNPPN